MAESQVPDYLDAEFSCHGCGSYQPKAKIADALRRLAEDPHARAVLSKAFREAPLANAAESLNALADDLDPRVVIRPAPTTGREADDE